MITSIEINNIMSVQHAKLSLEKHKYQYLNEMIFNEKVVSPVAFYGTNGSGKSSFLYALKNLISLLIDEPNKLNQFICNFVSLHNMVYEKALKEGKTDSTEDVQKSTKSSVKVFFEHEDTKYEYFIETSLDGAITKEELIANGNQVLLREGAICKYKGNEIVLTSPLFPALRKLAITNDNKDISNAYEYLSNIAFVDSSKGNDPTFKPLTEKSQMDFLVEKSAQVREVLQKYKEFPLYTIGSQNMNDINSQNLNDLTRKEYFLDLEIGNKKVSIHHAFMSMGMKNQSLLLSILLSLPKGGAMIIDEIEDALHPLTIVDFLKVAQERNIQLIFSSHNTYILQLLRPDQIFFANWKEGFSSYKRLSEIYPNIREINNIEKMYLSHLFDEDIKKDD